MHRSLLFILLILLFSCSYAQQSSSPASGKADSLFFASNWQSASMEYEQLLSDQNSLKNALLLNRLGFCYQSLGQYSKAIDLYKKAEANHPASPILQQTIYSRMAKSYGMLKDYPSSLDALKKAEQAGFFNVEDLDSAAAYAGIRSTSEFKVLRDTAYYRAFPCMANPHAREFDFWVGEWDVFVTATKQPAGQSVIQREAGGCFILENWKSTGGPFNGKSMNFLDSNGRWQQVWMGSNQTTGPSLFLNGEYKDGAMRFVFAARDQTGNVLQGKFTFFNEGPNRVRQLQETSADGKSWRTVYDFTYIRKGKS